MNADKLAQALRRLLDASMVAMTDETLATPETVKVYEAAEEALEIYEAAPQQAQAPKTACMDQFCACRGGPAASCEEGEREAELESLRSSLGFYKRRCDLLQQWQSKMRDPERVLVCDILANGQTLPESTGRYALTEVQQAQAPGWQLVPVEPTPEMLAAVVTSLDEHLLGREAEQQYREDWVAMLAAAPQQGSKS